ncbi:MAG: efflux RND transporter permease subunit [Candidatus Delongbacteria bacterium]|nr:efflux RND transporter permease subunit [Candidatus Delongbacteria bacterium]MBN2833869.1 efflux RND transporter permease subunit [Candidatus Delongbacteria bacterium]
MNIGNFSVKNPVLLNILMVAILVIGFVSFMKLPRELETDVSFSWAFIIFPYPGVSAEEIEKNIIVKVEDEISDIDKIDKINSICSEGQGFVQVQFEDDISKEDFNRLFQELRTEIGNVSLPDGALDPIIDDFTTADFVPIIRVVLKGDADPIVMNDVSRDLQDKLLDIDNVSKAQIVGGQDREIWIEVDGKMMEAKHISLDEIANSLTYKNMNIPGGEVKTKDTNYILRTVGESEKIDDFKNVIVRRTEGQGTITIGDLAKINSGLADGNFDSRFNGEKAISILISKNSKGNSITIVDQIEKLTEEYKKTLPEGIKLELSNNTTWMIKDTLSTLGSNSMMGFGMLVFILFVFIGWRSSLITALGIPIAFAITFIFMEYIGETINSSSLFALVLVLGMIVDHAIVIIENSYRYRQSGMSAHDAAIKGVNEVVWPVLAATGTTIAAFLPLMLLPGIMGKFMRVIPIVVSLALVASTLEALFFLPSHFADWGGKKARKETGNFKKLQNIFIKILKPLYRHRYITFILTILVIISSLSLLGMVRKNLFEGEAMSLMLIDIELPTGTSRERTNEVAKKFEEILLPMIGNGEIVSVSTNVGFMEGETEWKTQSNVAQISIALEEIKKGRKRSVIEVLEDVKAKCSHIPGAEIVKYRRVENGPPVDKPVTFKVLGDNYSDMLIVTEGLKQILNDYEELYNIDDNYDEGAQELKVKVNEVRAIEYGLTPAQIGMYLRGCFDGITATKFFDNDEEIDVIVKLSSDSRNEVADITQLKIPSPTGVMVPFNNICSLEKTKGISSIKREDKERGITVTADSKDQTRSQEINKRIEDEFNSKFKKLYPSVKLNMSGAFAEFNNVLVDIVRLLGVGLFLMYVILGAQFKSYVQPFIMMLTIPFAFTGCILYLILADASLSIVVLYAVVALAGIAVNDAIVLISFINNQRRSGIEVTEAVLSGAATRLRPIILTSVTTMAGLVPMALELGGSSGVWAPMASTIVFGLLFSTVGTLFIIPCVYGILNDITSLFGFNMKLEGE